MSKGEIIGFRINTKTKEFTTSINLGKSIMAKNMKIQRHMNVLVASTVR